MTDWAALAEPFPDAEIKSRPGSGGMTFRYVDARAVAQRLDDVLTPAGWQFTWTAIPGEAIVHGRLEIDGIVKEDAGYPNSDRDEEPMKAAVSDALKRCAVLFGVGRHLYEDNASSRRPNRQAPRGATPSAPAAASRPRLVDTDLLEPDENDIDALHAEPTARQDLKVCPIHDIEWRGDPGDLYHRTAEGRYCRHPDNVQKARAR